PARLERRAATPRPFERRHEPAGVPGRALARGVRDAESESRSRRAGPDGLPAQPRDLHAVPRSDRRGVHRLDAAARARAAVPRGHRPQRPLAVQERPGDLVSDSRSEEHTSELQSRENLVCRLLLEKKKKKKKI